MSKKSFLHKLRSGAVITLALCFSANALAVQTQPRITLGGNNTGAIQSDGTVLTWGSNTFGQLGDGTAGSGLNRSVPGLVPGLSDMVEMAAGNNHFVALRRDGAVFAWGRNAYGQLGDGTTTDRSSPVQVSGLGPGSGVIAVIADQNSFGSSYALKADGTVWSWGHNGNGRLGDGSVLDRLTPVQVFQINNARAISAGNGFATALLADGTVKAWGVNSLGQLGRGGTSTNDGILPETVVGLSNVKSIASGYTHTLALVDSTTVYVWGGNGSGNFCATSNNNANSTPVTVGGLINITQVAAGLDTSLFLQSSGQVQGCGYDGEGSLGDGSFNNGSNRTAVTNLYNNGGKAARVWAGPNNTAILNVTNTSSQQVLIAGRNSRGQAGVGGTTQVDSFTAVAGVAGTGLLRVFKPVDNFVSVGSGQRLDALDTIRNGTVADAYAVNLVAGQRLRLDSRFNGTDLPNNFAVPGQVISNDGYIEILDSSGTTLYSNDDCFAREACVDYVPTSTGVHYIIFRGYSLRYGNYTLHTPTYNGPHTNRDLYADILWRNTNTNQFVVWNMAGNYNGASGASLPAVGAGWSAKAQGDLDGDGVTDLIFQDSVGNVAAWLLDGLTVKGGGNIGWMNGFSVIGTGDLDGDGRSDIILRNGNQISVWFMDGLKINGNFAIASAGVEWPLVAARDMNGDTKDDMVFHNASTGQVAIWTMNGKTITSASIIATTPTTWSVAGLGDFNDDKRADILWRNNDGTTAVWLIDPAQANPIIGAAVVATVGNEWRVKATGDYNGDGKADILWHRNDGLIHFWFMNGLSQLSSGNSSWSAGFEWQPIQ